MLNFFARLGAKIDKIDSLFQGEGKRAWRARVRVLVSRARGAHVACAPRARRSRRCRKWTLRQSVRIASGVNKFPRFSARRPNIIYTSEAEKTERAKDSATCAQRTA